MAFLKMTCLVLEPDLPDGGKVQDKTTTVLVALDSILMMEENKGYHFYEGKTLTNIVTKEGNNLCAIGLLEEIAHKIETDKSRFVVDLTTPKSE
jgi:hypothetical protein